MRQRSLVAFLALAASAVTLVAQGGGAAQTGSTVTVTGPNGPIDGAEMRLFQNGRSQVLGASIDGKFMLNPTLLSGKPQMDVRVDKCPNQVAPTLTFYVNGPASAAAENDFKGTENCSHDKILAAFYWGSNWSYKMKAAAADSGKPFYKNPLYDALIGGGAVAGVYVATRKDDTDNGDGNGNGNGTSNDFGFTDANGTYSGTLTKQSDTGCNFSNSAPVTGTLTLNSNGTGTWVKTHTGASQTFSFSISAEKVSSGVNYTATPITNRAIGAGTYTVTDSGSITKSNSYSITITQTFTGTNGTACTVVYKGTVTRQ